MSDAPSRAAAADTADAAAKLDTGPFYWLTRAYGGYQLAVNAAVKRLNIDAPDWRVLLVVADFEPASVSKLSECLAVPSSTMVKAVQRMQARGLVVAAPAADDRRVTHVRLTDAGRDALREVRAVTARVSARAFNGASKSEVAQLTAALTRLTGRLEDRLG